MNWTLIKKNQYKAYLKWVNWVMRDKYADNVTVESEIDETGREGYLVEWDSLGSNTFRGQDIRALYSFFDEQGIYVTIIYDGLAPFQAQITQEGKSENGREYVWHLPDFRILDTWDKHYKKYITRTEAEEQAFLKAFEILEEK